MLLGIAGQTAAYAVVAVAPGHAMTKEAGCDGMMKAVPRDTPCHGLTPDCIAKMGCSQASALPDHAPRLARPGAWQPVRYPRHMIPVTGLTVEPEIFPPIALS